MATNANCSGFVCKILKTETIKNTNLSCFLLNIPKRLSHQKAKFYHYIKTFRQDFKNESSNHRLKIPQSKIYKKKFLKF